MKLSQRYWSLQHMTSAFLKLYSIESLDSRINPDESPDKKKRIIASAHSSRWHTLEFKLYLLAVAIAIPLMFVGAISASSEANENYLRYQHLLSKGWIFGRKVDNSDSQYRFFRDNLLSIVGLIFIHQLLRKASTLLHVPRIKFDFVFALLFLFGAHGFNCFRILLLLSVNFAIAKFCRGSTLGYVLTWSYGISTLFINDYFRKLTYTSIHPSLAYFDGFKGIIERWDVFFNFTLLRMLSFTLDYYEKCKLHHSSSEFSLEDQIKEGAIKETIGNKKFKINSKNRRKQIEIETISNTFKDKATVLNERQRQTAPLPLSDYNFINYIAYVDYAPLLIAGPIITFNDYIYQSRNKLPSLTSKSILVYLIRLIGCILTMEFILHFCYVVAISKAKAWEGDSPFQISMIGFFNLIIIWLKLLIPWRVFRFWSLLDGVDPPENMIRCVNNNYSSTSFWRAWHRSYNKWVVRYIYIPLGGSKHSIINSLAVFTFVAIWHDIQLQLLLWGWLIVFFLLPEIGATYIFPASKWGDNPLYRHICAVGAIVNIWTMIIANLFGFCLGSDGTKKILKDMFTTLGGGAFFVTVSIALFIGAQVMFEIRESEKRRGIYVRC